jgi:cytochrome c oxidase subunit 2
MNVHRFEKFWIAASMVLIVAWIATVTYGAVGPPGISMIDDSGGTVDQTAIANNQFGGENFREPGVYESGEDHYDVYVVARQFQFSPGSGEPIRVPADSTVTFHVTSADVIHGFEVVGTNVNAMVIPGQVTEMTVRFDGPTSYGVICNEYCGAGHHTMAGTIEVVPREQFQPSGGSA